MSGFLPSSGTLQALGWPLVHSLWQAALVLGALSLVLRRLPLSASKARYRVSLTAGVLVLTTFLGTAAWLTGEWRVHARCWELRAVSVPPGDALCASHGVPGSAVAGSVADTRMPWAETVDRAAAVLGRPLSNRVPARALRAARRGTPWVGLFAAIWMAGTLVLAIRTLADLYALHRLRADSTPMGGAAMQALVSDVTTRLGVPRGLEVRASPKLLAPGMAGWWKPTVFLPQAVADAIDHEQLRFLLAHEAAHARAGDYPLGLVQLAAERLLFFNPFARGISRIVSREREALRDRMAVEAVEAAGGRRGYARMLLALEGWRTPAPGGLMPAMGEGALLGRVRRLAQGRPRRLSRAGRLGLCATAIVLSAILAEATFVAGGVGSWAVMSAHQNAPGTGGSAQAAGSGGPQRSTLDSLN